MVTPGSNITMRVGLHVGRLVAGVVGQKDPRYHLFGNTVSHAMFMESSGIPDKIQASEATFKVASMTWALGDHRFGLAHSTCLLCGCCSG